MAKRYSRGLRGRAAHAPAHLGAPPAFLGARATERMVRRMFFASLGTLVAHLCTEATQLVGKR